MEIHDKEESKRGITPLWCEKEKDPERNTTLCPICGKWIKNKKYCSGNCAHYANRKVLRPSREELEEILRKESLVSIGRKYRVSDNTIKKWAKGYGLVLKTRSYNRSANI
jgi:predicted amidophosphoribosyltransferase